MNLYEAIKPASEAAYHSIGEGYQIDPVDMPRSRTCRMTSQALLWRLEALGFEDIRQERRQTELVKEHYYLVTFIMGEETVIDPTWQQFLLEEELNDELPDVLVGPRSDAARLAIDAGVWLEVAQIWAPQPGFGVPEETVACHPAAHKIVAA